MTDSDSSPALTPTSQKLASTYGIWLELAAGRVGPRRDEITPAQLRGTTASTFMIDVIDGGQDFRFRFAGDRVIQFMGRRLAGTLLSELRGTLFFDAMHHLFERCMVTKAPVRSGPVQTSYPGKEFLEIETVIMPLSDDGVNINCLFGGLDSWQVGTHGS